MPVTASSRCEVGSGCLNTRTEFDKWNPAALGTLCGARVVHRAWLWTTRGPFDQPLRVLSTTAKHPVGNPCSPLKLPDRLLQRRRRRRYLRLWAGRASGTFGVHAIRTPPLVEIHNDGVGQFREHYHPGSAQPVVLARAAELHPNSPRVLARANGCQFAYTPSQRWQTLLTRNDL